MHCLVWCSNVVNKFLGIFYWESLLWSLMKTVDICLVLLFVSNQHNFSIDQAKIDQTLMSIYEFNMEFDKSDFFSQNNVQTEYIAYELLKQKPIKCDVNYVAVPWYAMLDEEIAHKTPLIKQLGKFADLRIKGGFTICQHIYFRKIIPILKLIGVDVLFTPHAVKDLNYEGISILPFPHHSVHGIEPAADKDLWYSFIGYNSHPCRNAIFKLPNCPNTIIKERSTWHFHEKNEKNRIAEEMEYRDVLARSRFSLCPRGSGPGTLRFWESLQAGAIPVLIADDAILPDGFDWQSCVVYIKEKFANSIDAVLKDISFEKEQTMRYNCLKAWKKFSGKNFVKCIRNHYKYNKIDL